VGGTGWQWVLGGQWLVGGGRVGGACGWLNWHWCVPCKIKCHVATKFHWAFKTLWRRPTALFPGLFWAGPLSSERNGGWNLEAEQLREKVRCGCPSFSGESLGVPTIITEMGNHSGID